MKLLLLFAFVSAAFAATPEMEQERETSTVSRNLQDLPMDVIFEIGTYYFGVQWILSRTCRYFNVLSSEFHPASVALGEKMMIESLQFVPYHRDMEVFADMDFRSLPNGPQLALKFALRSLAALKESPCARQLKATLHFELFKYFPSFSDKQDVLNFESQFPCPDRVAMIESWVEVGCFDILEEYYAHDTVRPDPLITSRIALDVIKHLERKPEAAKALWKLFSVDFWKVVVQSNSVTIESFLELAWPIEENFEEDNLDRAQLSMECFASLMGKATAEWVNQPQIQVKMTTLYERVKKSKADTNSAYYGFKETGRIWGLSSEIVEPTGMKLYFNLLWRTGRKDELIALIDICKLFHSFGSTNDDELLAFLFEHLDNPQVVNTLKNSETLFKNRPDLLLKLYSQNSLAGLLAQGEAETYTICVFLNCNKSVADFELAINNSSLLRIIEIFQSFVEEYTGTEETFVAIFKMFCDRRIGVTLLAIILNLLCPVRKTC